MNPIRLLRADEIECRVSTISEKGLSLLLYKDTRVDQTELERANAIFERILYTLPPEPERKPAKPLP